MRPMGIRYRLTTMICHANSRRLNAEKAKQNRENSHRNGYEPRNEQHSEVRPGARGESASPDCMQHSSQYDLINWLEIFFKKISESATLHSDVERHIADRKLRHVGFNEFDVTTIYHDNTREKALQSHEIRGLNTDSLLHIPVFGDKIILKVQQTSSVLHPQAAIMVTNGDTYAVWKGDHPNCFLSGTLQSHNGTVSLSYCDGLQGIITTPGHDYHVEQLPSSVAKRFSHPGISVLVSKKPKTEKSPDAFPLNIDGVSTNQRRKRSVPSKDLTIELAVYTDSEFTKLFPTRNIWKRLELMTAKYNGVQMEWGRRDTLGYNVIIKIKRMVFFDKNPSWYNMSTILGASLHSFCEGTKDEYPYDLMFMHTGMNTDVTGRAYQSSVCKYRYRCGINNAASFVQYTATAHEIGHTLGMLHDDQQGCNPPDVGVMGGYGAGWSTCSRNDMNTFLQKGHGRCLWQTNITPQMIRMPDVKLTPKSIGQLHTLDEICEMKYGANFRYREYPLVGSCSIHSCVNYNMGPKYGEMIRQNSAIPGAYCGDGKICHKTSCVTWSKARQNGLVVRAGGWSTWGTWQPCSRPCGTGMRWRRRECNNPTPLNHAPCEEGAYEAETCYTRPCPTDSHDTQVLVTQRASEACDSLIRNHVINETLYERSGSRYSYHGFGQCEVTCDPTSGHSVVPFTRFGLMPHGTPCDWGMERWDKEYWPRRRGHSGYCLEGQCLLFGCDGKLDGATYDECGICGGDSTTCHVVSGIYRQHLRQDDRKVIARIPVGAYKIQFWFDFADMRQHYLEIWSKDDAVVMSSRLTKSWVYKTGDNPINFAGSMWHFNFHDQYLYTEGPLTAPAVIKVFNFKNYTNKGINYAYSVPLPGSCYNGGTYDRSICSCRCPPGFYGNHCLSRCNTYCMNGAPVNQRTCNCSCNPRQMGDNCACKPGFTGVNCQLCKNTACTGNKILSPVTCTCVCPYGFSGPKCLSVLSSKSKPKNDKNNVDKLSSSKGNKGKRLKQKKFDESANSKKIKAKHVKHKRTDTPHKKTELSKKLKKNRIKKKQLEIGHNDSPKLDLKPTHNKHIKLETPHKNKDKLSQPSQGIEQAPYICKIVHRRSKLGIFHNRFTGQMETFWYTYPVRVCQ
ncbi:hypothetical protein FSP39_021596 [Pinctada imbricata]|uniref:Peptidase M12B domain-containing protein n=1 Tax=Pinctada imbricata TaxID=66713 RepID=A0AA88XXM6_PINIB|nr:hypothetical protein FSP39_021596 [Pinctada imbricata]